MPINDLGCVGDGSIFLFNVWFWMCEFYVGTIFVFWMKTDLFIFHTSFILKGMEEQRENIRLVLTVDYVDDFQSLKCLN